MYLKAGPRIRCYSWAVIDRLVPLLLALAVAASGCGYDCDEAQADLAAAPTIATDLSDGRYALGASVSRELLDRLFAQSIADGKGFPRTARLGLDLPELGRADGDAVVRVTELRLVGDGSCPSCVELAVTAAADVTIARETLKDVAVSAVADLDLTAAVSGREVALHGEVQSVRDVDVTVQGDDVAGLVEALIRQATGSSSAGAVGEIVGVVLGSELARTVRQELLRVLQEGLSEAATEAIRQSVGKRELAALELPTLGTVQPTIVRAEVRGDDQGVFVGLDPERWPAGTGVGPAWGTEGMTLYVPSHSVVAALDLAMQGGLLPSGIDPEGRPSDDGALQLRALALKPAGSGFEVALRGFAVEEPCGCVDLHAQLTASLDDRDRLNVELGDFATRGAKGSGKAVGAALALHEGFSGEQLTVVQQIGTRTRTTLLGRQGRTRLTGLGEHDGAVAASIAVEWNTDTPKPSRRRGREYDRRERERRRR